jgi:hypothetical protein
VEGGGGGADYQKFGWQDCSSCWTSMQEWHFLSSVTNLSL